MLSIYIDLNVVLLAFAYSKERLWLDPIPKVGASLAFSFFVKETRKASLQYLLEADESSLYSRAARS